MDTSNHSAFWVRDLMSRDKTVGGRDVGRAGEAVAGQIRLLARRTAGKPGKAACGQLPRGALWWMFSLNLAAKSAMLRALRLGGGSGSVLLLYKCMHIYLWTFPPIQLFGRGI
jgi:hypothetical protein